MVLCNGPLTLTPAVIDWARRQHVQQFACHLDSCDLVFLCCRTRFLHTEFLKDISLQLVAVLGEDRFGIEASLQGCGGGGGLKCIRRGQKVALFQTFCLLRRKRIGSEIQMTVCTSVFFFF